MNTFESTTELVPLTIVVTGGGGGAPVLAQGISEANPDSRVVLVPGYHDHGGSSGVLRDQFPQLGGVGDIKEGLIHLGGQEEGEIFGVRLGDKIPATLESIRTLGDKLFNIIAKNSPELDEAWVAMQIDATDELAQTLVDRGLSLHQHTYGNLELAASVLNNGDIGTATAYSSLLVGMPKNRSVLPASILPTELRMHDFDTDGNEIIIDGEDKIDTRATLNPKKAWVEYITNVPLNPAVVDVMPETDALIPAPGSFWTSVAAPYLAAGMAEAVASMPEHSTVFAVANATKDSDIHSLNLGEYVDKLDEYINPGDTGRPVEKVFYDENHGVLPEGVEPAMYDADQLGPNDKKRVAIGGNFIVGAVVEAKPNDTCVRSKVHHNGYAIGKIVRDHIQLRQNDSNELELVAA